MLGTFPAKYLGTMSSGAAIGGLIPSLLNVAIITASENSAQIVGFACFLISTTIAFACLPLTYLLQRNRYFQLYGGHMFLTKTKSGDEEVSISFLNLYFTSFKFYYLYLCNIKLSLYREYFYIYR